MAMPKTYDVVIIGGGPAGLTAGLYAARSRLACLLLEKGLPGGKAASADLIENFPGFPDGVSGAELVELLERQAAKFGLETMTAEVTGLRAENGLKHIVTAEYEFLARAAIVASGSDWQRLGVPGEAQLLGRGISFCATCDAPLYRGKTVAVIGGGNAAVTEALQLVKFADKVTVVHRRGELRATRVLQERAFAEPGIEFVWDSVVDGFEGKDFLESLRVHNVKTGEGFSLAVDGAFIAVGLKPATDFLKGVVPLDENGYVTANERMETGVPGVFAAGDVRAGSIRQVVSACGDGATAAVYAERFLSE